MESMREEMAKEVEKKETSKEEKIQVDDLRRSLTSFH